MTPSDIERMAREAGVRTSEFHYHPTTADLTRFAALVRAQALESAQKDAERYRWLRDTNADRTDMTTGKGILWPNEVSSVWWGLPEDQWDLFGGCLRCAEGDEFDAAIDAAITASLAQSPAAAPPAP